MSWDFSLPFDLVLRVHPACSGLNSPPIPHRFRLLRAFWIDVSLMSWFASVSRCPASVWRGGDSGLPPGQSSLGAGDNELPTIRPCCLAVPDRGKNPESAENLLRRTRRTGLSGKEALLLPATDSLLRGLADIL
jgi:hypothetical protein